MNFCHIFLGCVELLGQQVDADVKLTMNTCHHQHQLEPVNQDLQVHPVPPVKTVLPVLLVLPVSLDLPVLLVVLALLD